MATRNISYGTPVTGSGGITSLGSSGTLTNGYEWYIIDNTTDLALDRLQSGTIRMGGTTYNGELRIYLIPSYDGSTWPDVFDGTPSAEVMSAGSRDSIGKLAWAYRAGATSASTKLNFFFSVADLFGGFVPKKCAVFVVHSLTSALNGTAGNHTYQDTPVAETVN